MSTTLPVNDHRPAPSYLARAVYQTLTPKDLVQHRLEGIQAPENAVSGVYDESLFEDFFATANVVRILRGWYQDLGFVPCHFKLTMPQILTEMSLVYQWYGEIRFQNQTKVATLEELNRHAQDRLTTKFGHDAHWASLHKGRTHADGAVPQLHERVADRPCPVRSDGGKDRSFPLSQRLGMLYDDDHQQN